MPTRISGYLHRVFFCGRKSFTRTCEADARTVYPWLAPIQRPSNRLGAVAHRLGAREQSLPLQLFQATFEPACR